MGVGGDMRLEGTGTAVFNWKKKPAYWFLICSTRADGSLR